MKQERKRQLISWSVTIAVHALLLIALLYITLKAAEPQELEDGVPVMLGNAPEGNGANLESLPDVEGESETESTPDQEASLPEPETTEPSVTEQPAPQPATPAKTMSQDRDKSVAAEEAKRKTAEEEAAARRAEAKKRAEEEAKRKAEEEAKKKAEEEARRKAEEAARKAAVSNKVAGAFGSSKTNTGSGASEGNGNQGSTAGNDTQGATNGTGGQGAAAKAVVGSRTVRNLVRPSYDDPTSEGTVVVNVIVDVSGRVVSATIKTATTTSGPLRNAATAAAMKSRFSEGEKQEQGTITYNFKQR